MSRYLISVGLAIIAIVVLLIALVQSHRHVRSVRRELHRAKEQIEQSQTAASDLEKDAAKLKTELDAANSKTEQLQNELDTDQSQLKEQQGHERDLTEQLKSVSADRDAAKSKLDGEPNSTRSHAE